MTRTTLCALSCLVAASAAGAQSAPQKNTSTKQAPSASTNDIIVEGQLDLPPNTDTTARITASPNANPRESAVAKRQQFAFSQRVAQCALRGKLSNTAQLRAVIDDAPYKASQRYAQDRLKRIYVTCSEGLALGDFSEGALAEPENGGIFDRGALYIEAIRTYAPDLVLTSRETNDRTVQARFNALEEPRNRYRLPLDYQYFEVAVCMVRVQPRLSLRLVRTDGPPQQIARISNTIVDNAAECRGNAKKVYFNPTEFRIYIADAVYRWAVAARGVDSLIPQG